MTDYVKDWLGAYLDGELADDRRAWVEEHLADCPECQQELAELRALTTLLHADPAPVGRQALSTDAFTRQVLRRLPPSSEPLGRRVLRVGLRYAPLGLFGAWAFCQAVILISSGLLLALNLFPQAGEVDLGLDLSGGAVTWLGGIFDSAGVNGPVLNLLQNTWLGPLALLNLLVIVALGVLFLAWLAGYWSYKRGLENQAD